MEDLNLKQVGKYRPWLDKFGKSLCMFRREDGVYEVVQSEITARLTKEEFMEMDKLAITEYRKHAPTIQFLMKEGLMFEMEKQELARIPLQHTDPVYPMFELTSLPLPITHMNFASAKDVEAAAKIVGQTLEKTLLDELKSKAISLEERLGPTSPTDWLQKNKYYGPYYTVDGIMFQARPDVVRLVIALRLTPIQWEDHFKLLAIIVPQIRANYEGVHGIVHV